MCRLIVGEQAQTREASQARQERRPRPKIRGGNFNPATSVAASAVLLTVSAYGSTVRVAFMLG